MDKRYQVFVSSTYLDLIKERLRVMYTLLRMNCFPAGMELFPASDFDPRTIIKKVIEDSDYYVLLIGARFGTEAEKEQSFTQWEYEYAKGQGLPILTFLRRDPSFIPKGCPAEDEQLKKRQAEFRQTLKKEKWCKEWTTAEGLCEELAISFPRLMEVSPRVGWIRSGQLGNDEQQGEVERLGDRIREFESNSEVVPKGIEAGRELVKVGFDCVVRYADPEFGLYEGHGTEYGTHTLSLKDFFAQLAPELLVPRNESAMKRVLNRSIMDSLQQRSGLLEEGKEVTAVSIKDNDFNRLKVRLRNLGWIGLDKSTSAGNGQALWKLTRKGEEIMNQLV